MNFMNDILLLLSLFMALILSTISAMPIKEGEENKYVNYDQLHYQFGKPSPYEYRDPFYFPGRGRFPAYMRPRHFITCKRNPRICKTPGSPGPDCCRKRCVNLLSDNRNCGACGKQCKFSEMCCGGKCVNPSFNKNHCGTCNNRCINKQGYCAFGLCNY